MLRSQLLFHHGHRDHLRMLVSFSVYAAEDYLGKCKNCNNSHSKIVFKTMSCPFDSRVNLDLLFSTIEPSGKKVGSKNNIFIILPFFCLLF